MGYCSLLCVNLEKSILVYSVYIENGNHDAVSILGFDIPRRLSFNTNRMTMTNIKKLEMGHTPRKELKRRYSTFPVIMNPAQ